MASMILDQLDRFGPSHCEQLDYAQAAAYTRDLARNHYENFTVVSYLLPSTLRDDFRHVYSFCRWADDLGDETGDRDRSIELLQWWQRELEKCYAGHPRHPVFVALAATIAKYDIPQKPFNDLIDAFIQDQHVLRYYDWEQILDYCTRSANPVGHLVLYLFGYRDERRQQLADATCTALQLTNFWQDVARDIRERDRVYIPEQIAQEHSLDINLLVRVINSEESTCAVNCSPNSPAVSSILPAYRATIADLVARTRPYFDTGRSLWPLVERRFRTDLKLFTRGGEAILDMIEKRNYDTLSIRPRLGKAGKLSIFLKTMVGGMFDRGRIEQGS